VVEVTISRIHVIDQKRRTLPGEKFERRDNAHQPSRHTLQCIDRFRNVSGQIFFLLNDFFQSLHEVLEEVDIDEVSKL
jgi:hypothetical protein